MPKGNFATTYEGIGDAITGRVQHTDVAVVFVTFVSFLGDTAKTAAALNIPVDQIQAFADEFHWHDKVEALRVLGRDNGADSLAIELNRVKSFVQATRLFNLIDRVIRHVTLNDKEFADLVTSHGPKSSNTSCKAVAELVKAAQIAQDMLYKALGDTQGERTARGGAGAGSGDLLKALANMGADGVAKALPAPKPDGHTNAQPG